MLLKEFAEKFLSMYAQVSDQWKYTSDPWKNIIIFQKNYGKVSTPTSGTLFGNIELLLGEEKNNGNGMVVSSSLTYQLLIPIQGASGARLGIVSSSDEISDLWNISECGGLVSMVETAQQQLDKEYESYYGRKK